MLLVPLAVDHFVLHVLLRNFAVRLLSVYQKYQVPILDQCHPLPENHRGTDPSARNLLPRNLDAPNLLLLHIFHGRFAMLHPRKHFTWFQNSDPHYLTDVLLLCPASSYLLQSHLEGNQK